MTRRILVNGRELTVSLEADGRYSAGEHSGVASIIEVEPGVFSVLIGGRSFEVRTGGEAMYVEGERVEIEIQDPRARRTGGHAATTEGRQTLSAPMPGKVVRVLVGAGDSVEAGQGIVVVEAMKMQNEMKSPMAGRVVSLPVREGVAVGAGDVLAVVE